MINVLANKLPSVSDRKNLIWKNNDVGIYNKFSQYNNQALSEVKDALPRSIESTKVSAVPEISEISEVSQVSARINKIPKVLKVSPLKNVNNYPTICEVPSVPSISSVPNVMKSTKVLNPIKESKKNVKKPNPIDTILAESSTCDIYKSDVKEKLIALISSNEFSKVFGITKSAEIMTGIVNERLNKSIALFISFLFDKSVIYNDKEFIFNKNKEITGTINL